MLTDLSLSEELKKAAAENAQVVEALQQEKTKLAKEISSSQKDNDSQQKVCFQKQALYSFFDVLYRT